jgi:hypothetical protein
MWEVKKDATTKGTLFLIDAKDELMSMKFHKATDVKNHLAKLTAHFNLMVQCKENLTKSVKTHLTKLTAHFNLMVQNKENVTKWDWQYLTHVLMPYRCHIPGQANSNTIEYNRKSVFRCFWLSLAETLCLLGMLGPHIH